MPRPDEPDDDDHDEQDVENDEEHDAGKDMPEPDDPLGLGDVGLGDALKDV